MTPEDLKIRTKTFALRALKLARALPESLEAQHMGRQFLRAATSVAANYRAACRGRSKAEFLAKLGIVEEEADEALFWMELIAEGQVLPVERMHDIMDECSQLVAIISQSRITAADRTSEDEPNRQSAIDNRQGSCAAGGGA